MKRFIIYILLGITGWPLWAQAVSAAPNVPDSVKRILIISSYRQEVYWSNTLAKEVERSLLNIYPDAQIMQGNMNADVAVGWRVSAMALRSVLWSFTENTEQAPHATVSSASTMFNNNLMPDVIVFIGDEGFMHYQRYFFELNNWHKVPIVLCAVSDRLSSQVWDPEKPEKFDQMIPVDSWRDLKDFYPSKKTLDFPDYVQKEEGEKDGVKGCYCRISLNYTGVKIPLPVRKNLEMIHHLLPDLKELVWVDESYYQSNYARTLVEEELKEVMPNVNLLEIVHDRTNIDSIFDVMLSPKEGRAFLTWGLSIDGMHSWRPEELIDSLFTQGKQVNPLFSLTERLFTQNWWIGGVYPSREETVTKTVNLVKRVLQGEHPNDIPFEEITGESTILNRTTIERMSLQKAANRLEGVQFVNYPPTFYEKYEWQVLVSLLVVVIVLGACVYLLVQEVYNRRIRTTAERFKRVNDNLQTLYKHSGLNFSFYGEDGTRLMYITNGVEETAGQNQSTFFSRNLFQSPYLTDKQKNKLRNRETVNTEAQIDDNNRLVRHGLSERELYQIAVRAIENPNFPEVKYMASAMNFKQVALARREKERFETLFHFASDSAKVGVAFYHLTTGEGLATDSWVSILNEPGFFNRLPAYSQVYAEDRTLLLEHRQKVIAGQSAGDFCRDIRVTDANGTLRWVRQNLFYLPKRNLLVELNMDINLQKQSETNLSIAKQKAEQSNLETNKFLADISHEIRTPLNSIVGFSAILSDMEEGGEDFAPIILRNNHLLSALIDNILDLSELDAGQVVMKKEPVNVDLMIEEMEAYIRANLYGKPLRVVTVLPEGEHVVYTDKGYFHKLSMNLLTNAVKFTETGTITMGYRDEGEHYYFFITDTGCGIRAEDLPRLFKRFEKLNAYMQGTGLGLALCKSIVEQWGGEMGVESQYGVGSTFWYTLPKW